MQVSNFDVFTRVMAADAVNGAVFNITLPAGKTGGLYSGDHKLGLPGLGGQEYSSQDGRFSVSFATPGIVAVTNNTGRTIPAGQVTYLQLERPGLSGEAFQTRPVDRVRLAVPVLVDIGVPVLGTANYIATSQTVALNANVVLAKTAPDVPRNLVAAWTTAAVMTIRGKDEFGAAMTETSASGTAHTGKKAFASIDRISFSVAVTAATVGTGNALGLPIFINKVTDILTATTDTDQVAAPLIAGIVAGVTTTPTGLTGDVRGTWTPTSGLVIDGVKNYTLTINPFDLYYRGRPQFAG